MGIEAKEVEDSDTDMTTHIQAQDRQEIVKVTAVGADVSRQALEQESYQMKRMETWHRQQYQLQ